ncbi:putative O-methyltransferase [Achaetomium macrosporum]|uniref:O-methyltransferase n=1 Tax=Achaetomium macrosporum TaxID=79813 RepID=A0AAN7C124_9PEZI|nr:putative O-methyltransferase [Achaetomium macrosporum]
MTSDAANIREALQQAGSHFLALVEIGILKTFVDFRVFDAIPNDGDISFSELGSKTGAQPALLERFSTFLIASDILLSPRPGYVAHTARSRPYQAGGVSAGFVVHVFNFFLRPMACWPAYFSEVGLREPPNSRKIPLGLGLGHPGLDMYGILDAEPALAALFNQAQARSAGIFSLQSLYSLQWVEGLLDQSEPRLAFCAVFDLPKTVDAARAQLDGKLGQAKLVGGTMFEPLPQEIRGALVYQFRRVLSDFPDNEIIAALSNVRQACGTDTRVLIIEELLRPNRSKFAIAQDIAVFNFGGKRRSEAMFRELTAAAGFHVSGAFHPEDSEFGVLELVRR